MRLFDKIVNLTFYRNDGKMVKLECPSAGRKPTIRVSGTLLPVDQVNQVQVRITNFVTDVPLSAFSHDPDGTGYGRVVVDAGYAGSIHLAFEGEIMNAYQETPGPDGVTTFDLMISSITNWLSRTITATWDAGSTVQKVLTDVANALGLTLRYHADPSLVLPVPMSLNGLAKEMIVKLKQQFAGSGLSGDWSGLCVTPDGRNLVVTNKDLGTGVKYKLDYVSMANHNSAGYAIQSPWIPQLRPEDLIDVDVAFFRQSVGGSYLKLRGSVFKVLSLTFDFCTTDDTNMMTVQAMSMADIPQEHVLATPEQTVVP